MLQPLEESDDGSPTCKSEDCKSVQELLKRPFEDMKNKITKERIKILKLGRPTPPLPELKKLKPGSANKSEIPKYRTFNVQSYKKTGWLAGCTQSQKLYCWPCLLFSKKQSAWNKGGVIEIKNLQDRVIKHNELIHHINALEIYNKVKSKLEDSECKKGLKLDTKSNNVKTGSEVESGESSDEEDIEVKQRNLVLIQEKVAEKRASGILKRRKLTLNSSSKDKKRGKQDTMTSTSSHEGSIIKNCSDDLAKQDSTLTEEAVHIKIEPNIEDMFLGNGLSCREQIQNMECDEEGSRVENQSVDAVYIKVEPNCDVVE